MERMFNLAAGIGPEEDRLPRRFLTEPLSKEAPRDKVHRLPELLPQYYRQRGWGRPRHPHARELQALALC